MKRQITDKNTLAARMLRYENTYKTHLVDRMYTLIRLDIRAGHSLLKNANKPLDKNFIDQMIETTEYLCNNIQGCKLGYVQSDEITLVLTDFDELNTQAFFDNEVEKILSISASMATSKMNQLRTIQFFKDYPFGMNPEDLSEDFLKEKLVVFDSRVFQVSVLSEVYNSILARQIDATRNSISACAQSLYSPTQLHGKNQDEMQEMIFQKSELFKIKMIKCGFNDESIIHKENFNWNDLPPHLKRGMSIYKQSAKRYFSKEIYEKDKRSEDVKMGDGWDRELKGENYGIYFKWVNKFTSDPLDYKNFDFNKEPFKSILPIND